MSRRQSTGQSSHAPAHGHGGQHAINSVSRSEFDVLIERLFEAAPPLANHLFARRPYAKMEDVIDEAERAVLARQENGHASVFSGEQLVQIINAHPRLGAPKETLSEASALEQSAGRPGTDQDAEVNARLVQINEGYEIKFGFKLVEFVNGRSRAELVPVLQKRLDDGERDSELQIGLKAMMDIARDRLRKVNIQ
ncbi:Oxo-4-hydroxy-4-carboxy-5-ureidoimidazoline decarboxylase [Chytriomyces sp. MP71]|nr:Oxo-4-hydroxy-4-carboxy-5-ureidoimidazoline decarboxylase [Chytriomyces sp. MP71]